MQALQITLYLFLGFYDPVLPKGKRGISDLMTYGQTCGWEMTKDLYGLCSMVIATFIYFPKQI